MQGRIPENILEDILSRVDIVELISGYIPLKRSGRNFKAPCPFHHEKTPSFMVSPDRQIYHCFGCNKGGNAFGFLMEYERLEFLEAVDALAKKAGVTLPQAKNEDPKTTNLITQLYKVNELAAAFYEQNLNSASASFAKNYLLKRGVNEQTIRSFKLGYAQDKWDALINYLRAKGCSLSVLEKAGLVLPKEGGGYYDRFRNRIIFPIFDIKSRVVGFGGRVLDDSLPKYMNSPETPIYIKGNNLYGLYLAKDAIRENDAVIVVEGYLDFIIPYQEGSRNIVASLGTALTTEQVKLIKRYTQNVIMVYDPDKAGELATLRSLDIFIEEGLSVKIVSLKGGLDPDLFVRKEGIDKFKAEINQAQNIFDYKLTVLKSRYKIKDIEDKAKISAQMLCTINKFKNAVLKSEYIKLLADELGVKEDALLEESGKIKQKEDNSYNNLNQNQVKKPLNINPTEKLVVKLMLEENEFIDRLKNSLHPSDFQDERISHIVATMFEFTKQGKNVAHKDLVNHLHGREDILQVICESTFLPEVSGQDKEKVFDDCVQRLMNQRLKSKKQHLHDRIKLAQHLGNEEELQNLMQEFHNLIKKG